MTDIDKNTDVQLPETVENIDRKVELILTKFEQYEKLQRASIDIANANGSLSLLNQTDVLQSLNNSIKRIEKMQAKILIGLDALNNSTRKENMVVQGSSIVKPSSAEPVKQEILIEKQQCSLTDEKSYTPSPSGGKLDFIQALKTPVTVKPYRIKNLHKGSLMFYAKGFYYQQGLLVVFRRIREEIVLSRTQWHRNSNQTSLYKGTLIAVKQVLHEILNSANKSSVREIVIGTLCPDIARALREEGSDFRDKFMEVYKNIKCCGFKIQFKSENRTSNHIHALNKIFERKKVELAKTYLY